MDLGIDGRTALVLGAGGGLGRAIALQLAGEGANVALADIAPEPLRETATAVERIGVKTLTLEWDLSDSTMVDERVGQVESGLGHVEILVNITGGPPPTPVSGRDLADWRQHFDAMVLSVIAITDRVLPGMCRAGWGRVVTSTSSGVITPIPNLGLSNALRSTLVGWSKTLAAEVAGDGVTVNILVPGRIATDRIRFLDRAKAEREACTVEDVEARSVGGIPAARYGEPSEYAAVAAFLASAPASYVTGAIVRVDGGMVPSI